jgi:hypothetical protein
MHYLGFLVVLQVVCAVHVVKTGRPYWWLWIIFMVPGLGAAAYFIAELLPDFQRSGAAQKLGSNVITLVDPGRNVRQLEEELQACDTVNNRLALARGYIKAGRYGDAVALYEKSLCGVFKDDPGTLLELAAAHFLNANYVAADEILLKLREKAPNYRDTEQRLLYARTLEELGCTQSALDEFQAIERRSTGEETRCRYAMLLEKTGKDPQAQELFREIIKRSARSPRYYRRAQKEWIAIAKQRLKK